MTMPDDTLDFTFLVRTLISGGFHFISSRQLTQVVERNSGLNELDIWLTYKEKEDNSFPKILTRLVYLEKLHVRLLNHYFTSRSILVYLRNRLNREVRLNLVVYDVETDEQTELLRREIDQQNQQRNNLRIEFKSD